MTAVDLDALLAGVQTLVLKPSKKRAVRHWVLRFGDSARAHRFLRELDPLARLAWGPTALPGERLEWALGFTRAGLELVQPPRAVQQLLAVQAPAFCEGAWARAARQLGDTGPSAAGRWDAAFQRSAGAHAVLTVHGDAAALADDAAGRVEGWRAAAVLEPLATYTGADLAPPPGAPDGPGKWLHFGYRDGLARPFIRGVRGPDDTDEQPPGTLLLGCEPAALNLAGQSPPVREFLAGGSFGVFRPMLQEVERFEHAVDAWARELGRYLAPGRPGDPPAAQLPALRTFVKAKLCGRWPNGEVVQPQDDPFSPPAARLGDKVGFGADPLGHGCPFASHVRRMNPRGQAILEREDARPLFRRGMAFDRPANGAAPAQHGLLGLFFCASIEQQCEHLLGQWGARMPPRFPGDSRVKDPLMGMHDDPALGFPIPFEGRGEPLALRGLRPFVRTLGTAYGFYPPRRAFELLLRR